jgi:hypothetical protein
MYEIAILVFVVISLLYCLRIRQIQERSTIGSIGWLSFWGGYGSLVGSIFCHLMARQMMQ